MSYLTVLRNLLAAGGLYEGGSAIVDYLRGNAPAPTVRPTETPGIPTASPAEAPASNTPATSSRPSTSAARRPAMPLPPPEPEPPPSANAGATPQNTLLERLRERISSNMANEPLASVGDIGTGMLASRSPNFFTMLGAGLQTQREGQKERSQELLNAVKAETEDQYRRDQIAARREALADPLNRELTQARIEELRGRGTRGANSGPRPLSARDVIGMQQRAAAQAARNVNARYQNSFTRPSTEQLRSEIAEETARLLQEAIESAAQQIPGSVQTPSTSAPAQAAPRVPTIDARGRPIQ